jgi:hypothetical protein
MPTVLLHYHICALIEHHAPKFVTPGKIRLALYGAFQKREVLELSPLQKNLDNPFVAVAAYGMSTMMASCCCRLAASYAGPEILSR